MSLEHKHVTVLLITQAAIKCHLIEVAAKEIKHIIIATIPLTSSDKKKRSPCISGKGLPQINVLILCLVYCGI